MSVTEPQYPDLSGYTFEKVWAVIQESHQRSEQEHQRFEQEHQKFMQQMQELRKKQEKTDRQMKETNQQLGRLGNRIGEFMETILRPGMVKKFNELGYSFDGEFYNLIIKDPQTKQRQTELDVILENGESVVVVEIKINPCKADVEHFAQQLQYFRAYRNRNNPNDTKKIFGALAAAVFPDNVQKFALDLGYYVIVPSGESIQIIVPEKVELKAF